MSIDPSSIPSFGAPQQPAQPPIIRPDADLVTQLLTQMELKHQLDPEGDLVAPWDDFRVYFVFRGTPPQDIFAVRSFYNRPYELERKGELLDVIDEWNRDMLWPKLYTHTSEDGVLRLIGESQMIVGPGVNIDYFLGTTANWIQAAVGFHSWLNQRLGLEEAIGGIKPEDGDDSSGDGDLNS